MFQPARRLLPGLVAALALALPAAASAAAPCVGADLVPAADNLPALRGATLCLINEERTSRGMKALTTSPQLRKAAHSFSRQMVRQGFFGHVSPGGSTLLGRVREGTGYLRGVTNFALGENLAWGSGDLGTPRETVRGWMESDGHRRNILKGRFRHIGVGVVLGAPSDSEGMPAATYTTNFGYRRKR